MSEGIIIAVITGIFAVIGQLLIQKASSKDLYAKLDKQSELSDANLKAELREYKASTDEKISELTREVRRHNNFAEKIPVMEAEEKRLNERIKALENKAS